MVDAVLIVTSILFAILVIVAAIYFLVYFQHPDDKWLAWFPKVVVVSSQSPLPRSHVTANPPKVLGLSLAAFNLFLLPLDVTNQRGTSGIPMEKLTLSFYISTVLLVMVGVPFTVFYYEGTDESDDVEKKSSGGQIVYALKWLIPTIVFAVALIAVLYWQLGYADIPTTRLTAQFIDGFDIATDYCTVGTCTLQTGYRFPWVSWLVYTVAIVSFAGWFVFSIFGGVGLFALPFDFVQEFQHRPKPITAAEYAQRKIAIGDQARLLIEAGKSLDEELKGFSRSTAATRLNRRFRTLRVKESQFRKDVLILEFHYRRLEAAYKQQGGNLIWQFAKLLFGCVGAILSLMWVIHIIVYVIPSMIKVTPFSSFLNEFFESVNSVPFFGTAFYAIFSFYLLACVIKGNGKLGMRIFFITIHPLRLGETMMNSLVFNAGVILLASLSVAQFCSIAFARFARYTASNSLFGVQIQNLHGIKYVFQAFIFILLAFTGLTAGFSIYKPYNKQKENRFSYPP
ncbi:hypothetical protein HDU67_003822 [Dinochytrium kinnereticum]|nr:hypothetical protein HDU67_003822 [Dinochytrium kinnereticum]